MSARVTLLTHGDLTEAGRRVLRAIHLRWSLDHPPLDEWETRTAYGALGARRRVTLLMPGTWPRGDYGPHRWLRGRVVALDVLRELEREGHLCLAEAAPVPPYRLGRGETTRGYVITPPIRQESRP